MFQGNPPDGAQGHSTDRNRRETAVRRLRLICLAMNSVDDPSSVIDPSGKSAVCRSVVYCEQIQQSLCSWQQKRNPDDADCADGLATTSAQHRFSLMILLRNPRFAALSVDVEYRLRRMLTDSNPELRRHRITFRSAGGPSEAWMTTYGAGLRNHPTLPPVEH